MTAGRKRSKAGFYRAGSHQQAGRRQSLFLQHLPSTRASSMEHIRDEVAVASTASPSPMPRPPNPPQEYFRFESMSTLTARVDETRVARQAAERRGRLPRHDGAASFSDELSAYSWRGGGDFEEEKFPIPDNPMAWVRYGFLDGNLLLQPAGPSSGGEAGAASPSGGREREGGGHDEEKSASARKEGRGRAKVRPSLVGVNSPQGESFREERAASSRVGSRERERRRHQQHSHSSAATTEGAAAGAVRSADGAITPSAGETAAAVDERNPAGRGAEEGAEGGLSLEAHDVGTPPTDVMTPTSQERHKKNEAAAAAGGSSSRRSSTSYGDADAGGGGAAAAADRGPSSVNNNYWEEVAAPVVVGGNRRGVDSLAVSMVASVRAASVGEGEAEGKGKEKERQQQEGDLNKKGRSSKTRPPLQTIAEMDRYKRNRAERLRAYGCQRYDDSIR